MESAINGYFKLSWRERIGFCSGDLAQNLIYQTVSIWLLFYYNNVYGLDSAVAVACRIEGMTAELAGVMARTGVSSLDKMDSTVIHRRTF